MKTAAAILILCLFSGCASTATQNIVTQVSTIDALLAGVYDGHVTLGRLLQHGNAGIGTFDKLDGEMVLIDGTVYQVKADGKVYRPSFRLTTPFAAVVDFKADRSISMNRPATIEDFEEAIDREFPNKNAFYAIRVQGFFSQMKTRSVPAQESPYPPLVKVVQHQPIFEMANVSGSIVGFRLPPYVKGINVPGYHLHFISDDLKSGGHVLSFVLKQGHVDVDVCNRFLLLLPEDISELGKIDLTKDRASELERVEK